MDAAGLLGGGAVLDRGDGDGVLCEPHRVAPAGAAEEAPFEWDGDVVEDDAGTSEAESPEADAEDTEAASEEPEAEAERSEAGSEEPELDAEESGPPLS